MCDDIYIGNTKQISGKRMDGHFYNLVCLLKNGQISNSFAARSKKNFRATTSCTDLRKYMTFKLVKQLKLIGAMKNDAEPNSNICME